MKQQIRLIASDIDGTLLAKEDSRLDPRLFDQIRELKQHGILFMAASGREYTNLRHLFDPVRDEIAYLCLNGSLTVYQDAIISRETMDDATAHELIRAFFQCAHTRPLASGLHTCYVESDCPDLLHVVRDVVRNDVTEVDDLLNIPEPYSKISAYEAEGVQDLETWKKQFGDRLTVQIGGARWLDCAPYGVSKATGFRHLLAHLNIHPEETVVFGDNDNDRQILQMAGTAIAVENAIPSIKNICARVVPSVPEALEQILSSLPE
jgi:Cof subfamily protein (haloacid dehalogenase superfamily)